MAIVFDTLGYSNRLQGAGVPRKQADAHAEVARDFIMLELVTKTELTEALDRQTLRLTIRFGGMITAAVAAIAALQKML